MFEIQSQIKKKAMLTAFSYELFIKLKFDGLE